MTQAVLFDPPRSGPGDYHAHIFHAGVSATAEPRYVPDYTASLSDYLREVRDHGLEWGTLIQPSFLGTDNALLLEALRAEPDRLRGVVVVDEANPVLTCPDPESWDLVGVRGVRLNLIGRSLPDLESAAWVRFIDEIAELGWHLEFQAKAPQLAQLDSVIDGLACKVVIDHVGLPDSPNFDAHPLSRLADLDHVWIKASGRYRSPDHLAERYVEALLSRGFPRLVFGSDWPHTRFETQAHSAWEWACRTDMQPSI